MMLKIFYLYWFARWTKRITVDTGRKLKVHTTFRRRPGRHLNVLCTFNLRPGRLLNVLCTFNSRPVSTGIWWLYEKIISSFMSFLSLHLNEILQSEIKQKLFSVQKTTCITAIPDKKIISVYSVYLGYCAPHLISLFSLNSFFSLALFSPGIHNWREKKLTNNYI